MTTVVQQFYRPTILPGLAGMIADMTKSDVQTRLCETVGGIGFGLAVSYGSQSDEGAVLGGATKVNDVTATDVTEWSHLADLNKNRSVWVPAECHTSFKQNVGSRLRCGLSFKLFIMGRLKVFLQESKVVARQHRVQLVEEEHDAPLRVRHLGLDLRNALGENPVPAAFIS